MSQKDMVDTLTQEGFEINERELTRVRLRYKWHLREARSNGKKSKKGAQNKKRKAPARGHGVIEQLGNAILVRVLGLRAGTCH